MWAKACVLLGILVLLTACASAPPKKPATVVDKSRLSAHAYAKSEVQCKAETAEEFCHVVERGDSLYSISRRYGLKVIEIASRNNIEAPYIIRPEDLLVVRLGTPSTSTTTTPQPATLSQPNIAVTRPNRQSPPPTVSRPTQAPGTTPNNRRGASTPTAPATSNTTAAPERNTARPTPRTTNRPVRNTVRMTPKTTPTKTGWRWPVPYEPLSTSGSAGLDYRLADGTEIVAAAAGKVIYAGAGLNKYRHLIIVDTQTSYLVAYEFNTPHDIKEGQNLSGGEILTTIVPKIGNETVEGDRYQQFRFEIWSNGKPLDPRRVIGR